MERRKRIHPKPKIRKSFFLQGQEISYFSAAVSGSISYFLMCEAVRGREHDRNMMFVLVFDTVFGDGFRIIFLLGLAFSEVFEHSG